MKRASIISAIFICMILALPLLASANATVKKQGNTYDHTSEYNSSSIDPTVLDELALRPSDKIVKVYNTPVVYAFSRYDTIEDILKSEEYIFGVFYAILFEKEGLMFYSNKNLYYDDSYFNDHALSAYFSEDTAKAISQDIDVYDAYYLSGETMHQGTAIYYETSAGDYVYYCNGAELLMPATVFIDYMRTIRKQMNTTPGGILEGTPAYGLYHYDMNSSAFNPQYLPDKLNNTETQQAFEHWPAVAIVALCILLPSAAIAIIYRKQKAKQV